MDVIAELTKDFETLFGKKPEQKFFSPGRVNLIGEHTDYNGGHVFPCAISLGTYGLVSKRSDKKVRMYSSNFKDIGMIEFDLSDLRYTEKHNWANYPKGVIDTFNKNGFDVTSGLDLIVYGTLPNGAGLSSSASIEVLMAVILNTLFQFNIDMIQMVKMCQQTENQFIGVNCGIMDQFAVGMGKENCAIMLDCNNLSYRYSKIAMDGYKIVISNTNKRRGLGDSKYNERRAECERALKDLQTKLSIRSLGELTEAEFEANKNLITHTVDVKRARHAVYENQRTLNAVKALEENDLKQFGKLMNDSHVSLRDLYEVTGIELDTLAQMAWEQKGVVGSRMTGAGFGGCTVSIVAENDVEAFIENITKVYTEKIGYAPSFYVANIVNGAGKLK
ncbi:MAG: galK [Firmicutes bacterium]|nr:galK [Bacillota bacterium]